ncbi:hypothetical protein B0H11DRAFT_1979426 [Mycena galericulata]|nr:hypothetical protein B0H11DRAFT_1979426 [Mycena galericulata]
MGLSPPTKREVLLVCLLLSGLFLVFVPKNANQFVSVPAPVPSPQRHQEVHTGSGILTWDASRVPQTKIIAHVPGWSIIDRLYIYKGVVFIVSDEPHRIPDVTAIYSKGVDIEIGEEAERTAEARALVWNRSATFGRLSRIRHYYHWSAELWYGFWRNVLDARPIDFRLGEHDSAATPGGLRSSFPDLTMEFIDDWDDRVKMAAPFVLERVVLADRSAAMPALNYQRYQRTAATAFALPGSAHWWMTIRNNVVQFAGLDPEEGAGTMRRPVITYISRQEWGRRMLIPADHDKLVHALRKLEETYGYEVNVVVPEKMTRLEQLQLAARTTILMGVHGNGLTSLLWMKPNPRSTVMEFFYPGGFAHDYEYTTRALGMMHYGFWDSEAFTSPNLPLPSYPEGFQGNSIPLDGEVVAQLCIQRLTLEAEADDG